ncbi:oxidoreductase [Actinotalea ferrariae CF5-4]|uniref:Oxidoreductase n=1 Tax=Actinotalea ferrariae CF5-4 TaxID=948458 RepID=A0A021VP53_9CELL|nr:oxidoreductase [Actinotalea ferrariae CF5-4]
MDCDQPGRNDPSASVLWALGDDATRAAVHQAHRTAVGQALAFVEQKVSRTRVGHAGCRQVSTRGVITAAFDHWGSRAGDPNLHTHVVVANKVQGPDGLWRSLDGKTVHAAVVAVSELYDVLLADDLARRLPIAMSLCDRGPRRNPAFEIDGIADDVLAHFSSRSEQIHCVRREARHVPAAPRRRPGARRAEDKAEQADAPHAAADDRRAPSVWHKSGLVFTTVNGRPIDPRDHSVHWVKFLEGAGLRPARLHDARHTAATLLLVQGVDQRVVMDMLGWTSPTMTARYQHVVPELVEEANRRMSELLWGET